MNCMNSGLVKRLAAKLDLKMMHELKDRKDKLKSKVFMKKLELLFEDKANLLNRCLHCDALYTDAQKSWSICLGSEPFIDKYGDAHQFHEADKSFDLNKFILNIRSKKVAWLDLFWKIFACTVDFKCVTCKQRFQGNRINGCSYHPIKANYSLGQNKGTHGCCNSVSSRFTTEIKTYDKLGCSTQNHKLRESDSPRKAV